MQLSPVGNLGFPSARICAFLRKKVAAAGGGRLVGEAATTLRFRYCASLVIARVL